MSEDDRRKRILKAAERLFQHYGVNKTTISDIADEADIGVGTVYLEYSSKDAIIEELACLRHEAILARLKAVLEEEENFHDRLRAYLNRRVEAFLELSEEGAHAFELVHCGCDAVESAYEVFRGREKELLASLLEEGAREGEFEVEDATFTAEVILRAYTSFSPPAVFNAGATDRMQKLEGLHRLIIRGILRR